MTKIKISHADALLMIVALGLGRVAAIDGDDVVLGQLLDQHLVRAHEVGGHDQLSGVADLVEHLVRQSLDVTTAEVETTLGVMEQAYAEMARWLGTYVDAGSA